MTEDSRIKAIHDLVRDFGGDIFLSQVSPSRNDKYDAWQLTVVLLHEVDDVQ